MGTTTTKVRRFKLDTITSKIIIAGALFFFTLISGLIVSRSGRPLNVGLVSVHKLIAIGSVALAGMAVKQLLGMADGKMILEVGLMVLSGILSLALIATGALLTREEMQLPALVLKVHQVAPLLTLVFSTFTFFMLGKGQS